MHGEQLKNLIRIKIEKICFNKFQMENEMKIVNDSHASIYKN